MWSITIEPELKNRWLIERVLQAGAAAQRESRVAFPRSPQRSAGGRGAAPGPCSISALRIRTSTLPAGTWGCSCLSGEPLGWCRPPGEAAREHAWGSEGCRQQPGPAPICLCGCTHPRARPATSWQQSSWGSLHQAHVLTGQDRPGGSEGAAAHARSRALPRSGSRQLGESSSAALGCNGWHPARHHMQGTFCTSLALLPALSCHAAHAIPSSPCASTRGQAPGTETPFQLPVACPPRSARAGSRVPAPLPLCAVHPTPSCSSYHVLPTHGPCPAQLQHPQPTCSAGHAGLCATGPGWAQREPGTCLMPLGPCRWDQAGLPWQLVLARTGPGSGTDGRRALLSTGPTRAVSGGRAGAAESRWLSRDALPAGTEPRRGGKGAIAARPPGGGQSRRRHRGAWLAPAPMTRGARNLPGRAGARLGRGVGMGAWLTAWPCPGWGYVARVFLTCRTCASRHMHTTPILHVCS